GVWGAGPEPAPEALARVVLKARHLLRQPGQDGLRHVLGVRFLQAPLAAPLQDLPAVALHEVPPRFLILGVAVQLAQQADAGPGLSTVHEVPRFPGDGAAALCSGPAALTRVSR